MRQSITLTAAEFVALAALLGETAPGTVGAPIDALPSADRVDALTAATKSLVERGIAVPVAGDRPRIPVAAARLVQIVCRPAMVTEIHRGRGPHWEPVPDRVASVPEASVCQVATDGAFRFTPVTTADLLLCIADHGGLTAAAAPAAPGATLRLGALRAAVSAAAGGPEAAVSSLRGAGTPDGTAAAAGTALAKGARVAVRVVLRGPGTRSTGGEIAWVRGDEGYWLIPPVLTPVAGPPAAAALPASVDDLTARLTPASGEEIVAAIAACLPGRRGALTHND